MYILSTYLFKLNFMKIFEQYYILRLTFFNRRVNIN